jgi:hypothetical protein
MKVTVIHTAFEKSPRKVAVVSVGTRTGDEALEYAYHRTQNLAGSWSRNDFEPNPDFSEDVTVLTDIPMIDGVTYGLRSTSMGDQMIMGGATYKVAMCGFDRISVRI